MRVLGSGSVLVNGLGVEVGVTCVALKPSMAMV